MKHIKEYQNYDFIGQQAALHGMSREEWVAVYASPSIGLGIDESKYVMTYEKYVSYDKLKNWGVHPPSVVEDELRTQLINLFLYAGISNYLNDVNYTDQSSDKGIKWEMEVVGPGNKDLIHAYKVDKWRGQYEWYLNKKKSSKAEIQQYFLNKYVPKTDQYKEMLNSFNPDKKSHKHFKSQDEYKASSKRLMDLYDSMSSREKKVAYQAYTTQFKSDVDFKDFKGS